MARIPPTYSSRPPARHNPPSGVNRRARRARLRHYSIFTRDLVWTHWKDLPLLEEGVLLRVTRIARRRGKSRTWISKRFHADVRRLKQYQREQAAKLQKIYEEMQQAMLQGEHDHERHESD
jgi:hypothetical protein